MPIGVGCKEQETKRRSASEDDGIAAQAFPFFEFVQVDLKEGESPIDEKIEGLIVTQPQKDYTENELRAYKAIPVNKKSYPATSPELLDPKTKLPWTQGGFRRDIDWWAANRTKVNAVWQKWVLR